MPLTVGIRGLEEHRNPETLGVMTAFTPIRPANLRLHTQQIRPMPNNASLLPPNGGTSITHEQNHVMPADFNAVPDPASHRNTEVNRVMLKTPGLGRSHLRHTTD